MLSSEEITLLNKLHTELQETRRVFEALHIKYWEISVAMANLLNSHYREIVSEVPHKDKTTTEVNL